MTDEGDSELSPPARYMPSNSTMVGTVGGVSAAPFIVWALEVFTHQPVPSVVAASLGAFLGQVAGYFFKGGRKS
jgi:hypothetical protein